MTRVWGALIACVLPSFAHPLDRNVTVTNAANTTLWFNLVSGSAGYNNSNVTHCRSNANCTLGSACNLANGLCFWIIPTPTSGVFRLSPGTATNLTFPFVDNGSGTLWSGNLGVCSAATCSSAIASVCDAGSCSAIGPGTIAEWTFAKVGTDYYDISIIGGVNYAIEMAPMLPPGVGTSPANPYLCTSAGGRSPRVPGVSGCNWSFTPPTPEFSFVSAGGKACSSALDCDTNATCGYSLATGAPRRFSLRCGGQLGLWSAGSVCGSDVNDPRLQCNASLPAPNAGLLLNNLYGCTSVPSCYQPSPGKSCCGCVNWNWTSAATTQQCSDANPNWLTLVLPRLQWLKQGCPTAYTYPFDDMSSTFVCSVESVGYSIVISDLVVPASPSQSATPSASGSATLTRTSTVSATATQSASASTTSTPSVTQVGSPSTAVAVTTSTTPSSTPTGAVSGAASSWSSSDSMSPLPLVSSSSSPSAISSGICASCNASTGIAARASDGHLLVSGAAAVAIAFAATVALATPLLAVCIVYRRAALRRRALHAVPSSDAACGPSKTPITTSTAAAIAYNPLQLAKPHTIGK